MDYRHPVRKYDCHLKNFARPLHPYLNPIFYQQNYFDPVFSQKMFHGRSCTQLNDLLLFGILIYIKQE